MILQARCGKRRQGPCCINFEFPDGTETIPIQYLRHTGKDEQGEDQYEVYWGEIDVKEAGPRLVSCLAHKQMMRFKALKTSRSGEPCGEECRTATGSSCKCSCGGINHGVEG